MRRDQAVDDPPMFPFLAVEHLFHHSLEGRVSGMRLVEFIEDGEGRGRYDRQFHRCFCVAAGQGVCHYVSHAGSKLDAEVEADELAGPLVLRDGRQALIEEEFLAEVIGLDEEWTPPIGTATSVALLGPTQ
jgi:hypothetical protein